MNKQARDRYGRHPETAIVHMYCVSMDILCIVMTDGERVMRDVYCD